MTWQEDKEDTGSSPYPTRTTSMNPLYMTPCPTSGDNKNSQKADTDTTKSWSPSPRKLRFEESEPSSETSMPNLADQTQPGNTSGKKTPELKARSSNLEIFHYEDLNQLIGTPSERLQLKAIWKTSLPTFLFVTTLHCEGLAKTTYDRLVWSGPVQFSGGEPALESREGLGMKRHWRLSLKIQTPNFGTVTEIMNMWLLMNFEECSVSRICSAGSTVIRVSLKSRVVQLCCAQQSSG